MQNKGQRHRRKANIDPQRNNLLLEVKFDVDALRTVRTSIMELAYHLSRNQEARGYVVLVDSTITTDRLREEWDRAAAILRGDVIGRLGICLPAEDRFFGLPQSPDAATQKFIAGVVNRERGRVTHVRTDYSFVIFKLLLHQWLLSGEPVTSEWLARTAGCSYPAVARAIRGLGGLVERRSDRSVALRYFPEKQFQRALAVADRARGTVRFADRSGQPRSAEEHLQRLEKINPRNVAIGGVLGAKHYLPRLDLVGTPRLDLSQHCPGKKMNLEFVEKLDPALKRVEDPQLPATLVVHAVRQANAQFVARRGGLQWADPVECLFDLHEAGLEWQASQLLEGLEKNRPEKP